MVINTDLVLERVFVAGLQIELERPRDVEALIDERAFDRDEFLPYWAELWPSALALADHVASLPLQGVRVLELGCGLGLPSLVAAMQGASVVATDWAEDAVPLLARNSARNAVTLEVATLRFDDIDGFRALGPADLVLAADVLYERRNADELLELAPVVVSPGGALVIADPGRPYARRVLQDALQRGWTAAQTLAGDSDVLPQGGIYTFVRDSEFALMLAGRPEPPRQDERVVPD